MDLSTLKNMDVKDLLEKLKGQAIFSDKKTLSKFAIIFGSIIIFLFTYHFWISPKIFQPQKNMDDAPTTPPSIHSCAILWQHLAFFWPMDVV